MKIPKLSKKDVVYLLIILNIVIWSASYVKAKTFYTDYVNLLIHSANAEITAEVVGALHGEAPAPLSVEDYVKQEWTKAGAKWEEVWGIVNCESRWNPWAIGDQGNSRGLYQIHQKYHPQISTECAFDPVCSTKEAIKIWQKQGWQPWSCKKIIGI